MFKLMRLSHFEGDFIWISLNLIEFRFEIKESRGPSGRTEYKNNKRDDISQSFDYSYVSTIARVAVYDDMKMPPHVLEIEPAPTADFIEHLASTIDAQVKRLGGKVPIPPYAKFPKISFMPALQKSWYPSWMGATPYAFAIKARALAIRKKPSDRVSLRQSNLWSTTFAG